MTARVVDRDMIELLVDALFRYVDEGIYVRIRAFIDRSNGPPGAIGRPSS